MKRNKTTMEVQVTVGVIKAFLKKHPNEQVEQSIKWESDDRIKAYGIDAFTDAEQKTLFAIAEELVKKNPMNSGAKGIIQKLRTYWNIKDDPGGRKVGRLDDLQSALKLYLSKADNHWVFVEEKGHMLPYFIVSIEYFPYEDECPAHVNIRGKAIDRGHSESWSHTWHTEDIKGGQTAAELLAEAGAHWPSKQLLAAYEKTMARYKELKVQMGEQFTGIGSATIRQSRWTAGTIAMVREGIPAKFVMDDNPPGGGDDDDENQGTPEPEGYAYGDDDGLESDAFWRTTDKEESSNVAVPTHPFLQMFDLDQHNFVTVHADQLTEYKWVPDLGEKLILPPAHKEVVTILMDTASEEISDIIAGKSGGTIVICTGDPGTGKTLTAEVTSEVIKRPLYKVQCSQLGTNEVQIEKKLKAVLNRAARWRALLLIDEADVYVRERGTDLQQNAIVGVFLRVLEYYRGVLFLTSNRATVIDDAIMSRGTVHLKYTKPLPDALTKIWGVLATQYGLDLSDKFIDELVTTFPDINGRDVKNLLKLAIRYKRRKGGKIDLALFKLLSVHKDITPVEH